MAARRASRCARSSGLLPLAAVAVFEEDILAKLPKFRERARLFSGRHPELVANMHLPRQPGVANRRMLSIVDETKLRRILARMLDEDEFFGPHGIRALSRYHLEHPYVFHHGGQEHRVAYVPGDSDTGMFGGNSNWRGPVWMPINFLLYTSLLRLYAYYGEDFKVECPTGSGQMMTLLEVAQELGERLSRIFLRDAVRPAAGVRRGAQVPRRSALARPGAVPRVLPWRHRRRHRRQPPDRLDRMRGANHPDECSADEGLAAPAGSGSGLRPGERDGALHRGVRGPAEAEKATKSPKRRKPGKPK